MPEVAAVGAIAVAGRSLLLIRRGRPPGQGLWSLPGGRVEAGEADRDAVVREVAEETGLTVEVVGFVGEVTRPGLDDTIYRIRDFRVRVLAGSPLAGDDADDIEWVRFDDLPQWALTYGLLDALSDWDVLR